MGLVLSLGLMLIYYLVFVGGTNVAKQAPTVAAWGLPSEPWLFAIDGNGVIKTRLDGAIAENEIKTALDQLAA